MVQEFQPLSLYKHVSYGVQDKDYDTVGQALLWTLRKGLGEAFTPDVETAWSRVYATVASAMQGASGNAGWSRFHSRGDDMIFVRQQLICESAPSACFGIVVQMVLD